jgi:arylsulfatase
MVSQRRADSRSVHVGKYPFELAHDIGMDWQRWYLEHMFVIAPAAAYVGTWLQSFREFPPRQKPGSFNLERVMEQVTSTAGAS